MRKLLFAVVVAMFAVSCYRADESAELNITYKDGTTEVKTVALEAKGGLFSEKYLHLCIAPEALVGVAKVVVTPSIARANEGEEGYFVADDGFLYGFNHPDLDNSRRVSKFFRLAMSCLKTERGSYLAICKDLGFESVQVYTHKGGEYAFSYEYDLSKCGAYEPLVIDSATGEMLNK